MLDRALGNTQLIGHFDVGFLLIPTETKYLPGSFWEGVQAILQKLEVLLFLYITAHTGVGLLKFSLDRGYVFDVQTVSFQKVQGMIPRHAKDIALPILDFFEVFRSLGQFEDFDEDIVHKILGNLFRCDIPMNKFLNPYGVLLVKFLPKKIGIEIISFEWKHPQI